MRRITTTLALAAVSVALLAGCGGNGGGTSAKATAAPAVTTATAATTASHAVKLSAKWKPKLEALSNGSGVADCQQSGSTKCLEAQTADITTFTQIIHAIDAANATAEYPKTIAEITKLVNAADTYSKDQCPGDPNADADGSPCPNNAMEVTVGVSTLEFVMLTDEANASVV